MVRSLWTPTAALTRTRRAPIREDKHDFFNYNVSLPTGAAIKGIEVRLDAKTDSTSGAPHMCVQLSYASITRQARRRTVSEKIKPHHLERKAILYVRQSSAYQVHNNVES
jgi:hypothetical protein